MIAPRPAHVLPLRAPVDDRPEGESVVRVTAGQLEALGEGAVFILDLARRRARYLSPALARRIGHPDGAALDLEAARRLVHPDDLEAAAACLTGLGARSGPGVASAMARVRAAEGGWLRFELRCAPLARDRRGRVRVVLGAAIDLTERWALRRDLDRARRAAARAGEAARRRLARDLHDCAAQHLVALDLGLSSLERRGAGLDPAAGPVLADMRLSLAELHREIRTFSFLLHPPELRRFGLEAALSRFVDAFGRRAGLEAEMQVEGAPRPAPAEVDLALYRVAQEALMNVHRHAQARRLRVRLVRAPGLITLEVEDDGVGPPDLGDGGGVGLPGMRARLAELGGALELVRPGRGLTVRATVPLKG